jgi:hypothetical protein
MIYDGPDLPDVKLEVPLFVDMYLEVDDYGILNVISSVSLDPDINEQLRHPLYTMVDTAIEFHEINGDHTQLFAMANSLTEESERIRSVANRMEDRTDTDLFDDYVNVDLR